MQDESFTQGDLLKTLHDRDVDVPIEDLRRLGLACIVRRDASTFRFRVPLLFDLLRSEGSETSLEDECRRWRELA